MPSVSVRWTRASSRAWLDPHHWEQLFGAQHPTPVWPGHQGEALCLERVVASGSGPRKLAVRTVFQAAPGVTRVALTQHALSLLDLHQVPAFGAPSSVGVVLGGPHGALVLAGDVCRAGPRLLLPPQPASRLGVTHHQRVDVILHSSGEPLETNLRVEVSTSVKEGLWVADGNATERLGDAGGLVTLRVVPSA